MKILQYDILDINKMTKFESDSSKHKKKSSKIEKTYTVNKI